MQKNITPAENMPDNSTTIIDGMLLIQKVAGDQTNFAEVVMALKDGRMSQRIDVVFDTCK